MLIVDSHLDIAWNALQWNRDLLRPAHSIRSLESRMNDKGRAQGTVALPDLRRGRIALSIVTVLVRSTGRPVPHIDFGSPAQAYAIGIGQIAYYQALERQGEIRIITNVQQLESHMAEWQLWDENVGANSNSPPPLGFVISMEGADPILKPDDLAEWYEAGLRLIGLSHYGPGRYAGGTGTELPVNELGVELLSEMERLGVLLDLTHCSDPAFWSALERYNGPVLASHNNCRELVPHQRQFTDEQIKAIIERDGVIGVAFDCWMLQPHWVVGHTNNENVTIETVLQHLDHICDLAGNARHVALGTDLDGGFGREQSPCDLDTIVDLQRIPAMLEKRGFSQDDIAGVMHGNWCRFLRESWNK